MVGIQVESVFFLYYFASFFKNNIGEMTTSKRPSSTVSLQFVNKHAPRTAAGIKNARGGVVRRPTSFGCLARRRFTIGRPRRGSRRAYTVLFADSNRTLLLRARTFGTRRILYMETRPCRYRSGPRASRWSVKPRPGRARAPPYRLPRPHYFSNTELQRKKPNRK